MSLKIFVKPLNVLLYIKEIVIVPRIASDSRKNGIPIGFKFSVRALLASILCWFQDNIEEQ